MLKRSQILSTLIELVGIVGIVAGVALLCVPAAVIIGGVAVAAVGVALGREAS